MMGEKIIKSKKQIWIPEKFVKKQVVNSVESWVVNINKQKIILPYEFIKYNPNTKGYIGELPIGISLPSFKTLITKSNTSLLIAFFPKKKMPKSKGVSNDIEK